MKRTAKAFSLSVVLASLLSAPTHADSGSYTQPKQPRPKVKVTFYSQGTLMDNFQVSYGQTLNLCMKITPTASTNFNAQPLITFGSNPPGAVQGSFGGTALCGGPYVPVQIVVSTSSCVASASLTVLVSSKPVTSFPGSIILPTGEYAVSISSGYCFPVGCYSVTYDVYFTGASGLNLIGIDAVENLGPKQTVGSLPNCAFTAPEATPGTIQQGTGGQFVEDDLNIPGGSYVTENCADQYQQTVMVGACTVQTNTLTFQAQVVGTRSITRSDQR